MSSLTPESIYSDAATLGKTSSYIYFIIAIVIAVILVIYALHINNQPQKPSTKAFIITASCTTFNNGTGNRNNISYSCLLNVKYKVNEIEYVNNLTTNSNLIYNPNTYIDIEYDSANPNNINILGMDNATQSKISIGIAVFIVAASGISYYLSQKSNVYAVGTGVKTLSNIL
jgi:hypothetical protein